MDLDKQQKKTKEYYGNFPGFRVQSGIKIPDGDLKGKYVDYGVMTDEGQGSAFYKHGLHKLVVQDCSYETVGLRTKEGSYAKIIAAKYGHIMLDAQDGDIVLKGRNIRLQAREEITLGATNQIYVRSPIFNIASNTTNILGVGKLSLGGNYIDLNAGVEVSIGTQSDSKQGGFLGMILAFAERFKDFL
mgnify:FL=1